MKNEMGLLYMQRVLSGKGEYLNCETRLAYRVRGRAIVGVPQ
jgi:hypothetical protein